MMFLYCIGIIAAVSLYLCLAIKFSLWLGDVFGGFVTYFVSAVTLIIGVPAGLMAQFGGS